MDEIIKDYRNNAALRHSFNELAAKTFGLNFEDWYQNGFWSDNYNPYSVVRDGRVVANVSVNKTNMLLDGSVKHLLQLGTVMTHEAYRNQGLIRKIMEQIEQDYDGKNDGYYLFANDSVLDFYPKFGFRKAKEYQYSGTLSNTGECQFEQILMDNSGRWELLKKAMERNVFHGRFDMLDNGELILFYVTKFMQNNVYYHKPTDTWVIAEPEGNGVFLHNVFSGTLTELNEVIRLFGKGVQTVTLGFVPTDKEIYDAAELHEEDCTLFVKGISPELLKKEMLRIPSLSHA